MNDQNIIMVNITSYLLYSTLYSYFIRKVIVCKNKLNSNYSILLWLYKLSCFNYTFVGIFMYYYPLHSLHFQVFFPINMIAQGIISYISDVMYFDRGHWSHTIDITFASYNTIIGMYLFYSLTMTYYEYIAVIIGILFQRIDNYFYQRQKVIAFMIFHILWHFGLPSIIVYKLIKI